MLRSRSFVSFMFRIAALGGGAVLLAACPITGPNPSSCCCVTGANGMRNCSPVSGPQGCPDGVVESCTSIAMDNGQGGGGPRARRAPSDGGAR
jgi:hypothetical protein